ncbi:MAG TPA: hypothetical protein VE172_14540 [Stackebrandtia sp.]|jgi:WD40 repeat protein|uniref:WD40 repeat domain-containing protein n=1 Tax=Stackebrandtia sp. TaxID=2023065 RepID=UPI002D370EC0|nr:hypothetical protein [Stackebrandtia sp.]HZE40021.1 hypothetical protein [Stackebrandtia sp.]
MPNPLATAAIPSDSPIMDFDVVVDNGCPLVVCADFSSRVFSWDPVADVWREHHVDNPWEDEYDFIELTAIAATVVDGRVLIGGGGDHQSFAQWDLRSGAVRQRANPMESGVQSAAVVEWDRGVEGPVFLSADSSFPPRHKLFAAGRDADPRELAANHDGVGRHAAGMLGDTPVLLTDSRGDSAIVWDAATCTPHAKFWDGPPFRSLGLITVDGQQCVVGVADSSPPVIHIGDPATESWVASFPELDLEHATDDAPDLESTYIGYLGDRPIAAVGMEDGTVTVWDLAARAVAASWAGHDREVFAIDVADLGDGPVLITAGRDRCLKLWSL